MPCTGFIVGAELSGCFLSVIVLVPILLLAELWFQSNLYAYVFMAPVLPQRVQRLPQDSYHTLVLYFRICVLKVWAATIAIGTSVHLRRAKLAAFWETVLKEKGDGDDGG